MVRSVEIDRASIATVKTSVERVLGHALSVPFSSADEFPAYWQSAISIYGGEDLALRIASELPVGSFGRASYAFASAATIGDALSVFRRNAQGSVAGITIELDITAADATVVMHGPELMWPLFEVLVGVLGLRCQQLPDPPVPITAVSLPGEPPRNSGPWEQLFKVAPRWRAPASSLTIPAALLERPLRTADIGVREALGTGPMASTKDEVRAHVRQWIRESPEAEEVARALGLSLRTLQRRLGDEGASFRQLVLEIKIEVAKELLGNVQLSIGEIASAVGFSRVPAFSRAFSQATGMTPSGFRSQLRK
ncbi:MAG: Transcriptional regulator, AraC family protein [Myxococcales bacterium]|nr:Transcriptional regulator, AraC family protein [Myxococcales bacterium]